MSSTRSPSTGRTASAARATSVTCCVDGSAQGGLRGEVVLHEARRDARGGSDAPDRGCRHAVAREALEGGRADAVVRLQAIQMSCDCATDVSPVAPNGPIRSSRSDPVQLSAIWRDRAPRSSRARPREHERLPDPPGTGSPPGGPGGPSPAPALARDRGCARPLVRRPRRRPPAGLGLGVALPGRPGTLRRLSGPPPDHARPSQHRGAVHQRLDIGTPRPRADLDAGPRSSQGPRRGRAPPLISETAG